MPAVMPNYELIMQTGLDPRTGQAVRPAISSMLKENIRTQLRINDEQLAVNRFVWHNLPIGLNGQRIERMLYYRGSCAFFLLDDQYFFLPYALTKNIDVYGRMLTISPVQFGGGKVQDTEDPAEEKPWIPGKNFNVAWDVILPEDLTEEMLDTSAVILHDYTPQYSNKPRARQWIQEPLLDCMADIIPYMRTALLNSTGISGIRVQGQDEESNVNAANASLKRSALEGQTWIPIVGDIAWQELTGGQVAKAEEFLMSLQALDNFRLGLYGLKNGGLFQKKAHVLESEESLNAGQTDLVMQDGLSNRQRFCDIVNSIWGIGIWCEPAESATNIDYNGDLMLQDNTARSSDAMEAGNVVQE